MIINNLKKTAFLLLICVALTGCQRKAGADINEEMDDYAEPGLRGELNIPEKESFEFGETNGKKILLDTENIILPETDRMESIRYKEIQIDRDYKKKVAECIFDKDNEIYEYNGKLSKEMHDENICYYKKCEDIAKKQGDKDAVEAYREMAAEEEQKKTQAAPLHPAGEYESDSYIGYIDGKTFLLNFTESGDGFELKRYPEELTYDVIHADDITYAYCITEYGDGKEQELIQTNELNRAEISKEEAIKEAGDFLADIGIGNVMMAEAATAEWLCRDLALGQNEESVIYDGYYITFTDAVESNPAYLGFCDETNILSPIEGDQRSMTSQIYEVNINDNGIVGIVCRQKYQRSDSKQDQQVLMDWDKLLETVSLEFDNYSNDNISGDIIFNYARLTYCMTLQDNGEFVLSPVWVFLSLDEISLEYQIDAYPNEMLIIDACTGKFITICTF